MGWAYISVPDRCVSPSVAPVLSCLCACLSDRVARCVRGRLELSQALPCKVERSLFATRLLPLLKPDLLLYTLQSHLGSPIHRAPSIEPLFLKMRCAQFTRSMRKTSSSSSSVATETAAAHKPQVAPAGTAAAAASKSSSSGGAVRRSSRECKVSP